MDLRHQRGGKCEARRELWQPLVLRRRVRLDCEQRGGIELRRLLGRVRRGDEFVDPGRTTQLSTYPSTILTSGLLS